MAVGRSYSVDEVDEAPQGSATWFAQRVGKLTASRMDEAVASRKDGKVSAKRRNLIIELIGERLTGLPSPHYVSAPMLWGREQEAPGKAHFTEISGIELLPCGFVDHPTIDMYGASPDSLIDSDGVFELKAPTTAQHLEWLELPRCPPDYQWQMLTQLACTGRRYAIFATFDPRLPLEYRMRYWRFEPDSALLLQAEQHAVDFLAELDARLAALPRSQPVNQPPRLAA